MQTEFASEVNDEDRVGNAITRAVTPVGISHSLFSFVPPFKREGEVALEVGYAYVTEALEEVFG